MKPETMSSQPQYRIPFHWLAIGALIFGSQTFGAGPTVSNVSAQQRADTKLVDVTYDLEHDGDLASTVTIEATTDGENWTLLTSLASSGAHGYGVLEGTGKSVVWAAGDEWPAQLFPAVKVRVKANDGTGGGVDPSEFSLVPAGTYSMGSPGTEIGRDDKNETEHTVTLSKSFYISKTEVTSAQWLTVRGAATDAGYTDLGAGQAGASDVHPISDVTWWDAVKYCNALSEQEGKTPVYYTAETFGESEVFRTGTGAIFANLEADGYRLPTEAEWEYACRAGTTTGFYSGPITLIEGEPDWSALDAVGWYAINSTATSHAVGGKTANAWGLSDTHGNVWEWCWDWYVEDLGVTAKVDPIETSPGTYRSIRGGGYEDSAPNCRSANRQRFVAANKDVTLGFRVAVSSTL